MCHPQILDLEIFFSLVGSLKRLFPEIVKFYSENYYFVVICLPDHVVDYLICLPWWQIYRPSWSLLTQNPLLPEFPYPILSEILSFFKCSIYLYCSSSFHSWLLWKQALVVFNGFDEIRKYKNGHHGYVKIIINFPFYRVHTNEYNIVWNNFSVVTGYFAVIYIKGGWVLLRSKFISQKIIIRRWLLFCLEWQQLHTYVILYWHT